MARPAKLGTPENKAIIKTLHDSGKSIRNISKLTGLSSTTVHKWLHEIEDAKPLTEAFANNRITLFRLDQLRAKDHITDEKLKNTSAKDLTDIIKKLWEMERVESGKSTSNISMAIYQLIQEAKQRQLNP